jgi:hypothetical protein
MLGESHSRLLRCGIRRLATRRRDVTLTLLKEPAVDCLRLNTAAIAIPALTSQVRPALILPELQARALLDAAARADVSAEGCFRAGPAGIQLWSGPFNGPSRQAGSAFHLGSIDWTYDTPAKHWALIYRAMVTQAGIENGETTLSVLTRVLGLTGLAIDGDRVQLATPPVRDPFRCQAVS